SDIVIFYCSYCSIKVYYMYIIPNSNLGHYIGLGHHAKLLNSWISWMESLPMPSARPVKIIDTIFDGVEVRVYQPHTQVSQKTLYRSIIYIHGGGWALLDTSKQVMAESLDAVVASINYRLVPDFHFPAQFEDILRATKHFLLPDVLAQYSVDPARIAVSGDSAGGNLAAAVCQEVRKVLGDLHTDPSSTVQKVFKLQALIYPVLQPFDFNTPSYQQNKLSPILSPSVMVEFWVEYFNGSYDFVHEANFFRDRLDWTFLLPSRFRKNYKLIAPTTGKPEIIQNIPALLDARAGPLLADKELLRLQPKTYIMTCEIDILRDDGLMYAKRLEKAGVEVTIDHFEDCFHGCMLFTVWPLNFSAGFHTRDSYLKWLNENL
uniref:Neutral cholesterol ester hydrolase 1 n=1 Tax=Naja naja TaxID=35670 RepID=A0A8C7E5I1_NAJNA